MKDTSTEIDRQNNQKSRRAKRLTPTDIAQYVRLGECRRYLKLRLLERAKGSQFLRDAGVAPQAIPPLLTRSGQEFEVCVEEAAHKKFTVVINFADEYSKDDNKDRLDNERVIDLVRSLKPRNKLLLLQPRLDTTIGDWPFVGDVDLLSLSRTVNGRLSALIVDMKSTTHVKVEHRLQVAFYHRMLSKILIDADIECERMELGILYRGPSQGDLTRQETIQAEAAMSRLGVPDALLEIVDDAGDYLAEVDELVVGPYSAVAQVTSVRKFAEVPYHLTMLCEGCLYQEFCLRDAHERDDLSLIPYLSASDKSILRQHRISTVTEAAGLMVLTQSEDGAMRLITVDGQEETVKDLRATSLGPRLNEIVHRAAQVTRMRLRQEGKAANESAETEDHSIKTNMPDQEAA